MMRCNECKRAFSKNNIKNELYVAGNGVEALDMLHTVIDPLPKIIILILIC
jgi:hypothetical protein